MTGEELKGLQRALRLSDAGFLEAIGQEASPAALRRLRRWKKAEAVPEKAAAAAISLSAGRPRRERRRE